MGRTKALRGGRVQFWIEEADYQLFDELRQQREQPPGRRSAVTRADIMIPWMAEWCRTPQEDGIGLTAPTTKHYFHARARGRYQLQVCDEFATWLEERGKDASAVLRAIVLHKIEPERGGLEADAQARKTLVRARRYQHGPLAEAVVEFLNFAQRRSVSRRGAPSDRDMDALKQLGSWVASQLGAQISTRQTHNPHAKELLREFASEFAKELGFALASPDGRALRPNRD